MAGVGGGLRVKILEISVGRGSRKKFANIF